MSVATLVLGNPGTGKSTSLRNLNPAETLLIQAIKKPLPFKREGWSVRSKENPSGNIFVTDNSDTICQIMHKTTRKVIVIDDWNLVMTNEYMRRSTENGFQKFSDIGRSAWEILTTASVLADDVRVYLLGHTEVSELGHVKAKTIGKMIDEKCPVESLFSIVFNTAVINDQFIFLTKNNGQNTVKTPLDMFTETHIPNDLAQIDSVISEYYGVTANA
jgi:hypothetical protein